MITNAHAAALMGVDLERVTLKEDEEGKFTVAFYGHWLMSAKGIIRPICRASLAYFEIQFRKRNRISKSYSESVCGEC